MEGNRCEKSTAQRKVIGVVIENMVKLIIGGKIHF